ncbi:MAG: lipopolysaccharide heptosyltransferase II [Acidobacteriota bacterium]
MTAPPRRLVIVAPNWLGDAVMALPLVGDLRRAWPEAEIFVGARRSVAALYDMVPGITGTVELDGRGGLAAFAHDGRNARRLEQGRFDAALLLPNAFHAAWLAWRAGIAERWGFRRDWRGRLLTRAMPRPPRYDHQSGYYQALAAGLGLPVGERYAAVSVTDSQKIKARSLLDASGLPRDSRFVVFAPGAAYGRAKQWLPERFAELATMITGAGAAVVLVGTVPDASTCREIGRLAARMTRRPGGDRDEPPAPMLIDLSGKTDLGTLAGVFASCDAVVANDSGAMHLAAAAGARLVAIFGPTNERHTAPLRASADAPAPRILSAEVWCRPCMLRECPIDHRCMAGVSAQAVFGALGLQC